MSWIPVRTSFVIRRGAFVRLGLFVGLLATTTVVAEAATFQVTSANGGIGSPGSLNWAIDQANSAAGPHSIEIDGSLGTLILTEDLPVVTAEVTFLGNNVAVDAQGHRGLFIGNGLNTINVRIENIDINNAAAHGGTGGNGGGGGGGGLGAGGGLFVNQLANVTIKNVDFSGNSALGGTGGNGSTGNGGGGGGGFGGAGGTSTIDAGAGGGGFAGDGGDAGLGGGGGGGKYADGGSSGLFDFAGAGGGGRRGQGGNSGVGGGGGGGGTPGLAAGQHGGLILGGSGAGGGGNGGNFTQSGSPGSTNGGGGGAGDDVLIGRAGGSGGDYGGGGGGGGNYSIITDAGAGGGSGVFGGGGGGGVGPLGGGGGGNGNDFGGGGGGGTGFGSGGDAGAGGFGGGGGGGGDALTSSTGSGGTGGFGAGDGGDVDQGGDGGDGYGGAIFVRQGGTLTYEGGIVHNSNTVQAGAGGSGSSGSGAAGTAASAVRIEGTDLVFGGSGVGIIDPQVGGTGGVIKNGSGVVVLQANNTYTGHTTVNQGTLILNGSIASSATVQAGSQFGGNGTVGGSVLLNGTISPGNSIGVFNIGGNLTTTPTSTVDIEVNDLGQNDVINVGGIAQLNGGYVNIQEAPGNYTPGMAYKFLNANGGVNGQFAGTIEDFPFLDATLLYFPQYVEIQLTENSVCYACIAANYNQFQVGTYLDEITQYYLPGDLDSVLDELNTLNTAQAQAALQSMDAEIYASLAQLSVQNINYQYLLLRQRVGTGLGGGLQSFGGLAGNSRGNDNQDAQIVFVRGGGGNSLPVIRQASYSRPTWSSWGLGYGIGGDVQSDGNAGGGNYGLGGMMVSLERFLGDQHALGFWGGYNNLNLNVADPVQSGHANDGQFGSYLTRDDGFNYWLAAGSVGFDDYGVVREMNIGDIHRTAQSDYTGWQSSAYGERGIRLFWGRALFQPFVAMQYIYVRQNALEESGAESLNLAVHGTDTNALRGLLGTRVAQPWQMSSGRFLVPELRAIWLHEFLAPETALNARFAGIGGASFITKGLNYGRDWAVLGGGLNWVVTNNFSLFANYDIQVNERQTFHVGSGGAQFVW